MFDAQDEICNHSDNEHFQSVLARSEQASVSRRSLIRGGIGLAAITTVPLLAACGGGDDVEAPAPVAKKSLSFSAVSKSLADNVMLPQGYTYKVVHATGDRLKSSLTPYSNQGLETDDWSQRMGDHHDGMELLFIGANGKFTATDTGRAVLAVNHESSADAHFFHARGQTSNGVTGKKFNQFGAWDLGTRPELESLKEINHHGVSIVEVNKSASGWTYKLDSAYNRRVTAQTPVRISGPAAHLADIKSFMVTAFDTTGATSRGTLNNCGTGITPWGTVLTGEENWAVYFTMPKGSTDVDAKIKASRARYGVRNAPVAATATVERTQGWHTVSSTDNRFSRWDVSASGASAAADFRNEPNTFGYNVEIDPFVTFPADGVTTAVKRVAMGRFAHEAAAFSNPVVGKPLAIYQGCDSQNEYIYKFVTAANWDAKDIGGGLAAGDKYLNEGKLYAAKFNADGTGEWLELSITEAKIASYTTYAFANQADVYVNARHAATAMGATPMDRPEWGSVNPANGDVYFALTNNSSRSTTRVDAVNPRAYADADGLKRTGNPNGHIVRFKDAGGEATAKTFTWDIFLFGAEEDMAAGTNLSGLTAANSFSSPDGLWFSKATGICWIQTDDGAFTDESNCMMLAAIPGNVGDGKKVSVESTLPATGGVAASKKVDTFVGATLGDAQLRRFLVGPSGCEVTGLAETPDGKTLFVNIQHPGEDTLAIGTAADFNHTCRWPGNQGYGAETGRPRSATIVITRTDGGVIGL